MMINLSLSEAEVGTILVESETFRQCIIRQLTQTQGQLNTVNMAYSHETRIVNELTNYIRNNFGSFTKIAGIKYVRQWALDHISQITPQTYERFYSLRGAKEFVENLIR